MKIESGVEVYHNIRTRKYELMFFQSNAQGTLVGEPMDIVLHPIEEMGVAAEPTLQIESEMMDSLMTNLWRQGCRPQGWQESVPTLDIDKLKYYLKDATDAKRELERERERLKEAESRLDRALELLGMEPTKRRIQVRHKNGTPEETEET